MIGVCDLRYVDRPVFGASTVAVPTEDLRGQDRADLVGGDPLLVAALADRLRNADRDIGPEIGALRRLAARFLEAYRRAPMPRVWQT